MGARLINPEQVAGALTDLAPFMSLVSEAQVLDFSRNAGYGPWVKLRFPEPGLLKGLETGQRYHVLFIHITEDEMPAAAEGKERLPYKLSQIAGMMCADENFRHFITASYGEPCHNKEDAAQWLREACGVESRSYLDVNDTAAETFRGILKAYDAWKQQGNEP